MKSLYYSHNQCIINVIKVGQKNHKEGKSIE